MARPVQITKTLTAADDDGIAASQGPVTGNFTINGALASAGVATLDTVRRVIITSAGNDSNKTFTVYGTNQWGAPIQETITGGNVAAVATNLGFKTITRISSSAATAGAVIAGTNGVGSTEWVSVMAQITPVELSIAITPTGTVNYTVEYTFQDLNNSPTSRYAYGLDNVVPQIWADSLVAGATTSAIATQNAPISAARVTINSGTGSILAIFTQAGIAGP